MDSLRKEIGTHIHMEERNSEGSPSVTFYTQHFTHPRDNTALSF